MTAATTDRCTHGGDCRIHPYAAGLHDYDAAEIESLTDQLAASRAMCDELRDRNTTLAERYAAAHSALRSLAQAYTDATGQQAPKAVNA